MIVLGEVYTTCRDTNAEVVNNFLFVNINIDNLWI